jgi:hypothetical protein
VEEAFSAYFLHSSLSLMAAIAILTIEDLRQARKRGEAAGSDDEDIIGFWGVDMAANEEYGDQRSGCHFFILEAMRRGIKVYVPPESCLLRPKPVYGISEWDHNYIKATARARELIARRGQLEQQAAEAAKSAHFLAGALDNHNYWINTWTSPFGIPSGLVVNHEPGTGLGGGITLHRPFSPPPDSVIEAGLATSAAGTAAETTQPKPANAKPKAKRRTKK